MSTPVSSGDRPSGRRQRRKRETKERIVQAAAALFAAQGYDSTTVEDIGERADVSRATVFNYFARKDDIVLEWFARRRAEMAETLNDANEPPIDAATRLHRALQLLGRHYEDDPETGRAMLGAWLRAGGPLLDDARASAALFADTIRDGQQRGDVAPDVDADLAGQVVFDAYAGVLYCWVRSGDASYDLTGRLTAMINVVVAGIGARR